MGLFTKIVDYIQLLPIFVKHNILLFVSQSYEYLFDKTKQNPGALSVISQDIGLQSLQIYF